MVEGYILSQGHYMELYAIKPGALSIIKIVLISDCIYLTNFTKMIFCCLGSIKCLSRVSFDLRKLSLSTLGSYHFLPGGGVVCL